MQAELGCDAEEPDIGCDAGGMYGRGGEAGLRDGSISSSRGFPEEDLAGESGAKYVFRRQDSVVN